MALYRHQPIDGLAARLDIALPGVDDKLSVAKSAITQARARLGDQPLRWLFDKCSTKWAMESARRHVWRGLSVLGVDGTTGRRCASRIPSRITSTLGAKMLVPSEASAGIRSRVLSP